MPKVAHIMLLLLVYVCTDSVSETVSADQHSEMTLIIEVHMQMYKLKLSCVCLCLQNFDLSHKRFPKMKENARENAFSHLHSKLNELNVLI